MKKILLIASLLLLFLQQGMAQNPFITSWSATTEPDTISITLNGSFTYDFDFVWKDSLNNVITSGNHTSTDGVFVTGLPLVGDYTLEITGDFPHFQNYPKNQLLDVLQWGDIVWGSFNNTFSNWTGSTFSATDAPTLSSEGVSFFRIFRQSSFGGDISHWNVSNVTAVNEAFERARSFNSDLSSWNISRADNYSRTFSGASAFEGIGLSLWNIEHVTTFNNAFSGTAISTSTYDSMLINWSAQDVKNNVLFGASGIEACDGEIARASLTDNFGWNITDSGTCDEATNILSFEITDEQVGETFIDFVNHNITLEVFPNTDVTTLTPNAILSEGASILPAIDISQDFTNTVDYTVTAEDGVTTQDWTVNVSLSDQRPFITSWSTVAGDDITIGLDNNSDYIFDYTWKDAGGNELISGRHSSADGDFITSFTTTEEVTLEILGTFPYLTTDYPKDQLIDVQQWGDIVWESFEQSFQDWTGSGFTAVDAPDLSQVTDMSFMFDGANNFNSNLNTWDVSTITNMQAMFQEASNFNGDISTWIVENVTTMSSLFRRATIFNSDISDWDVSQVTNMGSMFQGTNDFNADISEWRVDNVTNMSIMFAEARSFDQDISRWNLSKVTNMLRMFRSADAFNKDISGWDVSKVTNMFEMFLNADVIDQDFGAWNVSSVTSLGNMFNGSGLSSQNYDQTLIGWAALDSLQLNITLGAAGVQACEGEVARFSLIIDFGWNITDGGVCNEATNILSFSVPNQEGTSNIDFINHEITFRYIDSLDATALNPVIIISEDATIDPASEVAQDFTDSETTPVIYTVTAEDGITTQEWTVRLIPISTQTDIVSFEIPVSADIIQTIDIDEVNHEVNILMLPTKSLRFVQPEIDVSSRGSISPVSGNFIDLSSNSFTYTVTAEDGITQQDWTVTVETPINTATDFLTFEIAGQIGTSKIDTVAHQIDVTFPEGVAITALTPSFTLSGGATSSPVDGATNDFSSTVTYTVTAEDGSTEQEWTVEAVNSRPFITSWTVNGSIEIVLNPNFSYDFNFEWINENGTTVLSGRHTSANGNFTSNLPVSGTYSLEINGGFPHLFNYPKNRLIDVKQWGDISWSSFEGSFREWNGEEFSAEDTPDLSLVSSMRQTWRDAGNFNSAINDWNVSNVTDMFEMFRDAPSFNQDLNAWEVNNVTNFGGMFARARNFRGDVSSWDISSAENLGTMFANNIFFNSNVSSWNVSNAINMRSMFSGARTFNQDLSNWEISNVNNMTDMLSNSGMSVQNYDKFLISIAAQSVQPNVTFDAVGIGHCFGASAVASLQTDNGWTITDGGAVCSSENDILTIDIAGLEVGDEVIDAVAHTADVTILNSADLTALSLVFTLSDGAIFSATSHQSGETVDFTNAVAYEVLSSDSTFQTWIVTVVNSTTPLNNTDILTFAPGIGNNVNIDIDAHEVTFDAVITSGFLISPVITISTGASVSPSSGEEIDLSDGTETYTVTAEDGTTQDWIVNVNDPTPVNDFCINAIAIGVGDIIQASSNFATSDAAIAPTCGTNRNIGLGIWYKITGTGEALNINTFGNGTSFDTSMSIYTGSCETGLTCFLGNDDADDDFRAGVIFNSEVGQEYFILIEGFNNERTGTIELAVIGSPAIITPPNDDCEDAELLTVFAEGTGTPTNGNTTNAELFNRSNCDNFGAVNDVWFRFNSGANLSVSIDLELVDTDGADSLVATRDINLAVYTSCEGNTIVCDRSGNDRSINVTPDTDYWIQIWNDDLPDEGTFTIQVNDGPNTAASLALAGEPTNETSISRFIDQTSQVGRINANDAENHAQILSITAGNDEGIFAIDSISGIITVTDTVALRSSIITSFALTIQSADQGPGDISSEITITIDILDNSAPLIENQTFTIDENSINGTVIGILSASDLDSDLISFDEFTSTISGAFELSSAGELSVLDETLLDFENNPVITLGVSISDDGPLNLTATGTITINLNDVNEAPVVADATFNIGSASPIGFSIGVVNLNDQDTGQTHTFAITSDESAGAIGIDAATGEFTVVDPTALQANGTRTYRLTVEVTDDGTPDLSDSANIVINVFGDTAPVITSTAFSVNENTINGTVIGTLLATDAEGDDIVFSLVESSIAGAFSVNASGEIAVANQGALDFETNNIIELTVSATDEALGLLASQATITITVNDVNESFSVSDVTFNIGSSAEDGSIVGQVTGEDPDGDDLSFSITAGNSDNIFVINATSGIISVSNGSLLNPAETPQYTLTIEITDGEFVITSQATINVFANAAPVFLTDAFAIDENNEENALVGTIIVEDENGIQSINIISGNEDGIFELDGNNGELRVASSVVLNHEEVQEFNLLFRATDNGLGNVRTTEAITITINDVNEFDPVINSVDGGQLDENSIVGTIVATVNASDQDSSQTLTYTITTGNDAGNFAIDQNGQITTLSAIDFELTSTFNLTIEISDDLAPVRTISEEVEITVNNVNETLTLTAIADQNGSIGTEIAFTVEAVDPDNDPLLFSFAENSAQDGMQIDATTGVFTWTPSTGQFGEFSSIINVSDGEFTLSDTVSFNISNNETDILTFVLGEQTGDAVINATDHTVAIEVLRGTDVSALIPTITLSENASISPDSGVATNFNNAFTYTVTAENDTISQDWVVMVTEAPNDETDILTFVLAEQTGDAVINSTDHTVAIEVAFGTDVTSLTPTITLSEEATSDSASGATIDFTNAVTYTVTAEDGTTTQEWVVTVTVEEEPLSTETDILTFALAAQTGNASINSTDHTVAIEVAFGTDVTSLTPTITLSEGATSDPASEATIDFTNAVTYTITAEDGTTAQDWIVTVTEDAEELDTDTDILTFVLAEQTSAATVNAIDHSVVIEVAFGTDLTALTPTITLSEGATSDPASGATIDFTNAVTYTVTAEDGTTTQEWVVTATVEDEPLSTETDILTFALAAQTGNASINTTNHTVAIEVAFGTDVTTLAPTITLSEGAISDPTSGATIDFTNAVTYTVTAEDGTTAQDWIVTVTEDGEEPDTDTDILTFVLAEQTGNATVNATDHSVVIEVAFGTDLTALTPTFTLSEGATSDPMSGETVDFTNAVTYTVTAEDGTTTQDWIVTVTEDGEEPDTDTDILTFVLAEQTSAATVNATDHSVVIEVAFGTDLTALTPTFTLSEGATSDPVSGATVDFTNAVTYTVTAEDGTTTQEWIVTATIEEVITSIGEDFKLETYPNPATDILFVTAKESVTAFLIDLNGKTVSEKQEGNDLQFVLTELGIGTYILMIEEGGKIYQRKIIKN